MNEREELTAADVKAVIDLAMPHFGARVDASIESLKKDLRSEYEQRMAPVVLDVQRLKDNQGKALVGFGVVSVLVGSVWGIVWEFVKNKARAVLGEHP